MTLHIKQGARACNTNMKLGFVYEDGAGGVNMTWFADVGEHDLADDDGFRAAVEEACAVLGWTRPEWDFRYPAIDMEDACKLIMCRKKGSTPVLPGFWDAV